VGPPCSTTVELAWQARGRRRRRDTAISGAIFIAVFGCALVVSEVSPTRLAEGVPGMLGYVRGTLPVLRPQSLLADVAEWYWGLGQWLVLLGDTLLMAFMGTVLGAVAAVLLSFAASRTLVRSRSIYFLSRRGLEIARTVPELVYALIFVYAFGLGPLPGVLAIAVHSAGALGKLFAEAIENVDRRPVEGVRAAGASRLLVIRFAIVPQVFPVLLSHVLYYLESNTRSATILGVVGAGGIGFQLAERIRLNNWDEVAFIILMILAAVTAIDVCSKTVRLRVIRGSS
jgi:phosphonate transport system permease protein